jgi:hypothetical protein
MINWHRLFGYALIDLFIDTPWEQERLRGLSPSEILRQFTTDKFYMDCINSSLRSLKLL